MFFKENMNLGEGKNANNPQEFYRAFYWYNFGKLLFNLFIFFFFFKCLENKSLTFIKIYIDQDIQFNFEISRLLEKTKNRNIFFFVNLQNNNTAKPQLIIVNL